MSNRSRGSHDSSISAVRSFEKQFVGGTLELLLRHGWDEERGGLFERLTPGLAADATPFRRSMVHGRQLYVYAIWAERTGSRAYKNFAERIFEHLVRHFFDKRYGGWIEKTDLSNEVISGKKVLYSHAFILFGLSAFQYCLRNSSSGRYLDHTLDYISRSFQKEKGIYFDELDEQGTDISDGIDQNPLMHLLEALLFLYERSMRPEILETAKDIVGTVAGRMVTDGLVIEHLTRDFEPHPTLGHIVEPGHQVEWGWLLSWYGRLARTGEFNALAEALISAGLGLGWDRQCGGMFDQVHRRTGEVIKTTKRIWPLEELIKVAAVKPHCLEGHGLTLERLVGFLGDHYLDDSGEWSERLHADLSVADPTMPASTCYHTSLALTEALDSK